MFDQNLPQVTGGGRRAPRTPNTVRSVRLSALLARAKNGVAALEMATVWLNGAPAGRIECDGEPAAVSLTVENGRITRIYVVRNPGKLTRLDQLAELTR